MTPNKIIKINEIQQAESVSNGALLLGIDAQKKEKMFPAMSFKGSNGVGISNITKVETLPSGDEIWQITYSDFRTPTQFTLKKGAKGEKGDTGNGFAIRRIFASAIEMVGAAASIETGTMVAVITGNGADVYIRNPEQTAGGKHYDGFTYFTSLSDASVIRGEKGDTGEKGEKGDTQLLEMGLVSVIDYETFSHLTPQELQQLVQITGDGHLNIVLVQGARGVPGRDGDSIDSGDRDAIDWAKANMNGGTIGYVDYRETTHVDAQTGQTVTDRYLYFYKDEESAPAAGQTPAATDYVCRLDATAFIKDGMVSNVAISNGNLVITFNTDAGQQPIVIPLTDIFNPENYYTKTEIDNKGYLTATDISGKADRAATLPTASATYAGVIMQYTGATGNGLTHGYWYECKLVDGNYTWVAADTQDTSHKADKVSSPTNGNFAGLDANGNLTDSGSKASDFIQPQTDLTTFNGTMQSGKTVNLATAISSLTVNSIESGYLESNIIFTVSGSNFALTLPAGTKVAGFMPEFENGVSYILSAYKGIVVCAALNTI